MPVAIYKIDPDYAVKPFLSELMNATGMAFDPQGQFYVSSRYDGTVYRVAPNGTLSTYAEGMGVATGIAFDNPAISMWVIVAAPSGASRRIGKFSYLPPWNPALLRIIWPLRPTALCTLQAPPTPALTLFIASILMAQSQSSIADWAGRKALRLTRREIFTLPPRLAASAAL